MLSICKFPIPFRIILRSIQVKALYSTKCAAEQTETKLLKVSIIGLPNAGKSTLINQILSSGVEICPVSKRVHTTRENQRAVYLENNTQIVFMDTPGVVNRKETKKFNFTKAFKDGPSRAIQDSDLIGVVHDVSNQIFRHKLDSRVIKVLKLYPKKPTILILNKIDNITSKRKLLEAVHYLTNSKVGGESIPVIPTKTQIPNKKVSIEQILKKAKLRSQVLNAQISVESEPKFNDDNEEKNENDEKDFEDSADPNIRGYDGFSEVFMISALNGEGISRLKDYLVQNAVPNDWEFNEDVLTDTNPMNLTLSIVKSKILDILPLEIPYRVTPTIDFWEEVSSGVLKIIVGLDCPNERVLKIVIGQNGTNINLLSMECEKSLSRLFRKPIDLFINVTCKKLVKKETS